MTLGGCLVQLVSLSRVGGPERTGVLVTAASKGIAALLGGCINGTDCDKLLSSAEPGHKVA